MPRTGLQRLGQHNDHEIVLAARRPAESRLLLLQELDRFAVEQHCGNAQAPGKLEVERTRPRALRIEVCAHAHVHVEVGADFGAIR